MLCSVPRIVALLSFALIHVHVLVKLSNFLGVEGALPPGAEDEIVLIEHLPGRRVHLQDFFWSGAEDAPPWLDPDQTLSLYETRTIHHTATIYVPDDGTTTGGRVGTPAQDSPPAPYDPGCTSCIDPTPTLIEADQDIGVLVGDDPGPRYWLLTVLKSGETVPPKVELRLARLYRAAFSRQQQRHLGLLATDPRLRRAATKRRGSLDTRTPISNQTGSNDNHTEWKSVGKTVGRLEESLKNLTRTGSIEPKLMRQLKIPRFVDLTESEMLLGAPEESATIPFEDDSSDRSESSRARGPGPSRVGESKKQTSQSSFVVSGLVGPRGRRYQSTNSPNKTRTSSRPLEESPETKNNDEDSRAHKGPSANSESSAKLINPLVNQTAESSNSSKSKLRSLGIGVVQVRMQNMSVTETGSTRLVYSVHLGGKPVPAETAAKDMALLSPQEVALELGVPVIIQSEPYLKETRPLALSRKRDAWLLIGAAGAAIILLTLVIAAVVIAANRKRAHSAVAAPPVESILKKDRGYTPTTPGFDNTGYTSETEARTQTDGTSQRQTPGSHSRSPITPLTPESLEDDIQELSSDNDDELRRQRSAKSWDIQEYPESHKKSRKAGRRRVTRTNAIDQPRTPDSMDSVINEEENLESLQESRLRKLEDTASPHSYLSMPSCKLFPSMRSVEPLSKILEPVVVRHLDLEFETPEMVRRANGACDHRSNQAEGLSRTRSALKDPGVVGPIVWDLRRQRAVEESGASETEGGERTTVSGPVGRARRRLHELLEDSFSLFGTREARSREPPGCSSSRPTSAARSIDHQIGGITFSESRGKSAHVSPVGTPISQPKTRPRTSLPRGGENAEEIPETGNAAPHPRGAWGSRPLSAGPFHRPNLPEIDVNRVLTDHQLPSEDPAVPLIAAIRKELGKFTPEMRS
ncbi:uncharacterized protein [Venturia canescens]|uniref:uncharacterized protein n=1 Tax=Venturia canescens TaxID=32260 RepID=UPI001C9CAB8F|nr:uncharacterized protein LOC122415956 [Venturia canescens]